MKKTLSILLAIGMTATCLSGCGTTTSAATADVSDTETAAAAEASSEAPASEETSSSEATGVVIDASMNYLCIQTTDGKALSLQIADDSDTSALSDGILLGHGIKVSYDADENLIKAEDADTAAGDADALAAAGDVILAVSNKDIDAFADLCSYPVYIGIGDGKEEDSKESFLADYKADDVFTDALVSSVSATDLTSVTISEAGLVFSRDGAKPDIILSKTGDNGEWTVTGINE